MQSKMAFFVRVIPNRLYNKLKEDGHLESVAHFPSTEKSSLETLLSKCPETLQTQIKDTIKRIHATNAGVGWDENNQLIIDNKLHEGSDFVKLLSGIVLEDKETKNLVGWGELHKAIRDSNVDLSAFDNVDKVQQMHVVESLPKVITETVSDQTGGIISDSTPTDTRLEKCKWIRFEERFELS
jgi:hypothetical protein